MSNIEEVVRAAAPTRRDGVPIPDPARWPKGWVHLSAALASVAEKFANDGGGFEPAYASMLTLENPQPSGDAEFDEYQRKLTAYVVEQFIDACRFEFLFTGHRRIGGGGPVEPIPSHWWDTEDIFLRFRTWSLDPADELSSNVDLPNWIWVEERGLKVLCDQIWRRSNDVRTLTFVEKDSFISVSRALYVLTPFLPHLNGTERASGGPPGAMELRDLCASGAVKAVAARMERRFDASGMGREGELLEAHNNWAVPADLWRSVEMSPHQNWAAGTYVATPNARTRTRLEHVEVDWRDLTAYLEGQRLLLRVELREKDGGKPFAQGFVSAIDVDFEDEHFSDTEMCDGSGSEASVDEGGYQPTDRTGAPGRPSAMHLVEAMMRQRFKDGTARSGLGQEAEELSKLFASNSEYAQIRTPTAKTIKNNLGMIYRRLKADSGAPVERPEKK